MRDFDNGSPSAKNRRLSAEHRLSTDSLGSTSDRSSPYRAPHSPCAQDCSSTFPDPWPSKPHQFVEIPDSQITGIPYPRLMARFITMCAPLLLILRGQSLMYTEHWPIRVFNTIIEKCLDSRCYLSTNYMVKFSISMITGVRRNTYILPPHCTRSQFISIRGRFRFAEL